MKEMTKTEQGREQRRKEREQRAADRKSRRQESNRRQRAADAETYGEGSQLFEAQQGNIYDVETGEYDTTFNKQGTDETISNDGIDQFQTEEEPTSSDVEFNGSVLICIDGSPYYIDIPYDSDTGAYAASEGANFPIEEPE